MADSQTVAESKQLKSMESLLLWRVFKNVISPTRPMLALRLNVLTCSWCKPEGLCDRSHHNASGDDTWRWELTHHLDFLGSETHFPSIKDDLSHVLMFVSCHMMSSLCCSSRAVSPSPRLNVITRGVYLWPARTCVSAALQRREKGTRAHEVWNVHLESFSQQAARAVSLWK